MKLKHISFLLLFGLVLSCNKNTDNTLRVSLANPLIMDYWDNYVRCYSVAYMDGNDLYYPVPLHYEFEKKDNVNKREVFISTNENMDESMKYVTTDNFIDIEHLYANTKYYLKFNEYDGEEKVSSSDVQKIETLDYPRALNIPRVSNTRDIGNLPTKDGHRLAQGKIYRGANLDSIRDDGISVLAGELGVNTDLDLRKPGEGSAGLGSPAIGLNYINISGVMYVAGDGGIRASNNAETIRKEIQVFANPDNYPIYFHCAVGRDRTGTLAIILEALLGVEKDMILKEYELSFLSASGFNESPEELLMYAENVVGYIAFTGQENPNDDLAACTKNWLVNDIGVTEEEIDIIKDIMID